ncbi:MAG: class I SAM-dependent methyltransferase [Planctomycetota bacterium]
MSEPKSTESEIQASYAGHDFAEGYVKHRFVSEIGRLLHDRQVQAINDHVQKYRPSKVLEIAPGPGRITRDIRPTGELMCLEFNEGMIAEGRRACKNGAKFVQGNAFELPFGQEFDLVYSFRFIRHFHQEDRIRLYDQIKKVLKPKGCLIMDAVNRRLSEPLRKADPASYPIYDKLYDEAGLRREMAECGFETLELVPVQKRYELQFKSQVLLGPRVNWLNRMFIRGLERLPARDGLEWIITCRLS